MARDKGKFLFTGNFDIQQPTALDPRMVVETVTELTSKSTWSLSPAGSPYIYNGLVVAVTADNALYMLIDAANYNIASSWKRLDADAATVIEIVDDLETDDNTKALSASQGVALDTKIIDVSTNLTNVSNKVDAVETSVSDIKTKVEAVLGDLTEDSSTLTELIEEAILNAKNDIESSLSDVYRYKGTVDTYEELPTENLTSGDVYNVVAAHGDIPGGTNYAWNSDTSNWDALGGSVDLSSYAQTSDVETLESTLNTKITDVSNNLETLSNSVSDLSNDVDAVKDELDTLTGEGEGSIDSKISAAKSEIDGKLAKKVDTKEGYDLIKTSDITQIANNTATISTLSDTVNQLSETVTDLVDTVIPDFKSDTEDSISELNTKVTALEEAVGDAESGLVKAVADINLSLDTVYATKTEVSAVDTKVTKLNADKNTAGSVDYKINAALNDALSWKTYNGTES